MTVNRPIKKETVKKYLTAFLTTFSLYKMQRIAHMMLKFKILKIGTYINVITRTFSTIISVIYSFLLRLSVKGLLRKKHIDI